MKVRNFFTYENIKNWLIALPLGFGIVYLAEILPTILPEVHFFLSSNKIALIVSFLALVSVMYNTSIRYYSSLEVFEEETKETGIAIKINRKIWLTFWASWSVYYCLIIVNSDFYIKVYILVSLLVVIPNVLFFLFVRGVRKEEFKQEQETKERLGEKYAEQEPYNMFIAEKYETGRLSLMCIPIFFVLSIMGLLLKHFLND